MNAVKKNIVIDFSDASGGCNDIEHPTRYNANQISASSKGYVLKKSGLVKQPGAVGLSAETTFTDYLRGLFSHRQFAGTESLYAVSCGKLYGVSTDDGELTEKYELGADTKEAWVCDAFGKKFVCNGNKTVKIEGTSAYQVGISAPSGASALAATGAGLPDGEYSVYVGYARKVGGVNKLYSAGQSIGTVTLGAGNNQIAVTFPNSTDPQVNNKVVWVKSPGELIHYFFYQTDNNTTTAITISSSTGKLPSIVYEYAAADNGIPPSITFIYAFSGRLWGIIDNIIYYSDVGNFSEYDVEKWRASSYIITPYKLTGIFSVGQNLYFNSDNGVILLPFGDVNQQIYLVETRWHFQYMRTVSPWNNGVIGVTNQGVRIFDGEQFTQFDLAYPIRGMLTKIYSSNSNFQPCGFVYREEFRDEYHLMWQDVTLSTTVNNTHAVLNLSSIMWESSAAYNLAWEFQNIAGNYAVVMQNDNKIYVGQSHASASKVYLESTATTTIANVYDERGVLLSSATEKESLLRTREYVFDVSAWMRIERFYVYAQNDFPFTVQVFSGNDINKFSQPIVIPSSGGGAARFDSAVFDESRFPSETGQVIKAKMPNGFWCKSVYVEVRQSADDVNFNLLQLNLYGYAEANNYT